MIKQGNTKDDEFKKTLKEENHIPIAGADLVVSATSPTKNGSELLELPVSDSTQATDVIMTESKTVESHLTKQKPSGWKVKNQKKLYYKNGKKVTGWRFIGKYHYYFNENGVLQTDKMISKNKYVNKNGRLVDKAEIYSHQKKGLELLEKKCLSMKSTYSGTWCIYVKNLDTNKMLLINNQPLYPASLIKLFNMGYTYERVDQGKLQMTSTIESQVKSMITVSSNDSHNELLQTNGNGSISKGIDGLNNFCQRHGYLHTQSGGTLHPSYFSRVAKQNSYTTVKDCGHILEDIYRGVLVNETTDKHMLSLLKKQTRRSKIPTGIPANITVANKTGETDSVQHDAAIVFSPKADSSYIGSVRSPMIFLP
jgi:beta-lactamase class A